MQIKDFISQINSKSNKKALVSYLEDNISRIETIFYQSNFDSLNNIKFELEDLIFALEAKDLLNNDEDSIKAFMIILGDFYDRFLLRGGINAIFNYIPQCSVKNRLKASKVFLSFTNLDLNPFNQEFDNILQLIDDSFNDNDMGYRSKITLANFFLTSKRMLENHYQDDLSELSQAFYNKKNDYSILRESSIVELVNSGLDIDQKSLKNKTDQLHKKEVNSNISRRIKNSNKIIQEHSDYAKVYERSEIKSFNEIKNLADKFHVSNDNDHNQLERGTAIIENEALLFQYIQSYGNMHKAKLSQSMMTLPWNELNNSKINCVDWGCGQGIGLVCLHDHLQENNYNIKIENALLIEPSLLALKRAITHTKSLDLVNNVRAINKDIESLSEEDVKSDDERNITINIFSNIIDVPAFDLNNLYSKIQSDIGSQFWKSVFLIVSPNINVLRNQRIETFYNLWKNNYYIKLLSDRQTNIRKWKRYEKVFIAGVCEID